MTYTVSGGALNSTQTKPNCWLGVSNSIRPVKIEWWGVGVVICLEWDAYCLRMVQLTSLHPKTPSSPASFKSRLVLHFWYQLTQVVLEKRPLNRCNITSGNCLEFEKSDLKSNEWMRLSDGLSIAVMWCKTLHQNEVSLEPGFRFASPDSWNNLLSDQLCNYPC